MGSRTENTPLVLENTNRDGAESSMGESKNMEKEQGKQTGKHITIKVNEERIFFNG